MTQLESVNFESPDLRVEIGVKNNALWKAIHAQHRSTRAFADLYQLDANAIREWLCLKSSPYHRKTGELRRAAIRLCECLGVSADVLFPPALYSDTAPKDFVMEMQAATFLSLDSSAVLRQVNQIAAPVDDAYQTQELREKVNRALRAIAPTLTKQQQVVLTHRFGLDDTDPLPLDEIGKKLNVGAERVRQIEASLLRRLRRNAAALGKLI